MNDIEKRDGDGNVLEYGFSSLTTFGVCDEGFGIDGFEKTSVPFDTVPTG